jgi:hypothetical protein
VWLVDIGGMSARGVTICAIKVQGLCRSLIIGQNLERIASDEVCSPDGRERPELDSHANSTINKTVECNHKTVEPNHRLRSRT